MKTCCAVWQPVTAILGSLHDVGQPILAGEAYRDAIEIEQKLVKADPINRIYQVDLARTYSNLGFLSARIKDWKKADIVLRRCNSDTAKPRERGADGSFVFSRFGHQSQQPWHGAKPRRAVCGR